MCMCLSLSVYVRCRCCCTNSHSGAPLQATNPIATSAATLLREGGGASAAYSGLNENDARQADEAKVLSHLRKGTSMLNIKANSALTRRAIRKIKRNAGLISGPRGRTTVERQQHLARASEGVPILEGDEELDRDRHGLLVGVFPDKHRKDKWYAVAKPRKVSKDPKMGGASTILYRQHAKGGTTLHLRHDEAAAAVKSIAIEWIRCDKKDLRVSRRPTYPNFITCLPQADI